MESEIVGILFGSFLVLLLIGAPITVALGVASMISFLYLEENPIKFVQIAFTSVGSFPLMALPAFILAGALMEAAGISKRLINVAESVAGPFTGGMAAAAVMVAFPSALPLRKMPALPLASVVAEAVADHPIAPA